MSKSKSAPPVADKFVRNQWFIDTAVQLAMFKRMFVYWIVCTLLFSMPIALLRSCFGQGPFTSEIISVWQTHWPLIFTVLMFLPFVLYDMLKFSNRFVGPVYRLRRELRNFQETGEIEKIRKFRNADFWHDLYEGVNDLIGRIEELESRIEEQKAPSKPANQLAKS